MATATTSSFGGAAGPADELTFVRGNPHDLSRAVVKTRSSLGSDSARLATERQSRGEVASAKHSSVRERAERLRDATPLPLFPLP